MFYRVVSKSSRLVEAIALLFGLLCGGFYASFSRASIKQEIFNSSNPLTENIGSIEKKLEINETAQFLVSDDTNLADSLAQDIKVLCWIHVNNVATDRVDAIKQTWGKRCTSFVTIANSGSNSTDIFNIPKSQHQTTNIENAYRFIYNNYGDKFDWFLRTDSNSYVVMENLRYKLYAYDPLEPIGIGLTKNNTKNQVYLSEKAGYALSQNAVEKLANGFASGLHCTTTQMIESDEIRFSLCLKEVGIVFAKSTDESGKQLFFDKNLDNFFLPVIEVKLPYPWYEDYKVNHYLDSASNYSITFNTPSSQQMHVMEYLIYQLRPYGLETIIPPLPNKISMM